MGGRRLWLAFALMFPPLATATAHDIPNERVDRSIQVVVSPRLLRIDYEVSLAELTLIQDLRSLLGTIPPGDHHALFDRYGRETAPLNARGFQVVLDGKPLTLSARGFDLTVEEHPVYTFHLEAPLPPAGRLRVRDGNYVASYGTSRIAVSAEGAVALTGYGGPALVTDVPIRPSWQLSDAEERRTREVVVEFGPSVRGEAAARSLTPNTRRTTSSSRLARLLGDGSGRSLAGLFVVAFLLGAVHAVQPGHGKTLVAAASLGEAGSGARGAVIALATTLAHTGTVLVVAACLWVFRLRSYAGIHTALAGSAGFVIAAIGLWRLGRIIGGWGEHADDVPPPAHASFRRLLSLGLAGGLVPCWDAILLMVLALALNRPGAGLLLVTAFSLGMGAVLVSVGLLTSTLTAWLQTRPRAPALTRLVSLLSALALSAIGLFLLTRA